LPTLLDFAQQSTEVSSKGLGRFSFGAFFGSVGGAVLVLWFGSRWIGTALAFVGAVASVGIGSVLVGGVSGDAQLLMLCLVGGASINGMQAFMYAVAAHSYPTDIRGSAVGTAQTFSRIGAVLSPMAASLYFAMQPTPPVNTFFWFIAICAFVTTASFFLIPSHIPPSHEHGRGAIASSSAPHGGEG
jgi:AAHS family 4-hydroxybenzoate transporter-like MFS transporter